MTPDSDFSEARSTGKLPIAILLGLLTFVVTPIAATIVAIPFFVLGEIFESFDPTIIIANIFGLKELGGFFVAYFIFLGLLALLGNFTTAIISWFVYRSKKMATITFASALMFQLVLVAIVVPLTIKKSQEIMEAGIESEKAYQRFAKIGNVSFTVQDPYSDAEVANRRPEYGPLYKRLRIAVPVSVLRGGVYQVHIQYSFSVQGQRSSLPMKEVTETFSVGEHITGVEFIADDSFGFWSPASVDGAADIKLIYLVSEKELLDEAYADPSVDKEAFEQIVKDKQRFLKAQGLDTEGTQDQPTINKFVERKEVDF